MVAGVTISNGLAWSRDATTLYYIDTPTRTVVAYDYERSTGGIAGRRVVIQVPEAMGFPDGMAIDVSDNLWIAQWDGGCVGAWDPRRGRLLERIELPARRVTSCAFGGLRLDELYLTTARRGLDSPTLSPEPHSLPLFPLPPRPHPLPAADFPGYPLYATFPPPRL